MHTERQIAKLEAKARGEKYVSEPRVKHHFKEEVEGEEKPDAGRLGGVYSLVSGLWKKWYVKNSETRDNVSEYYKHKEWWKRELKRNQQDDVSEERVWGHVYESTDIDSCIKTTTTKKASVNLDISA